MGQWLRQLRAQWLGQVRGVKGWGKGERGQGLGQITERSRGGIGERGQVLGHVKGSRVGTSERGVKAWDK